MRPISPFGILVVALLLALLSNLPAQNRPQGGGGPGGPPGGGPPGGPGGGPGNFPPPPGGPDGPPPPPGNDDRPPGPGPDSTETTVKPSGVITVRNETRTESAPFWMSNTKDVSAVYVTVRGKLVVTDLNLTSSGDASSGEASHRDGLNAGLLADCGGAVELKGGDIRTRGTGAAGLFSSGPETSITMTGGTVKTEGDDSPGVGASKGGSVRLEDVVVETALAMGPGGTLVAHGGKAATRGETSPAVLAMGQVEIEGATISAENAEAGVIDGSGSLSLKDTALISGGKSGVRIFRSNPDNPDEKGELTMTGGSLEARVGPLFYVASTRVEIVLSGVKLTSRAGILLDASAGRLRTKDANGGHVEIKASGQILPGDVFVDSASSASIRLQEGSLLRGTIHGADLTLDATSKWNVSSDSLLFSLTETGGSTAEALANIIDNGHEIQYDPKAAANGWLGGKSYDLPEGGHLVPSPAN